MLFHFCSISARFLSRFLTGRLLSQVRYCWDVLKSARPKTEIANHLTFLEFIAGVQAVRKDDVLKGRLDFTKPCPWDMLSLLIDTPVSKIEEERLYNDLTQLEKMGLGFVKKMQRGMHRCEIGLTRI